MKKRGIVVVFCSLLGGCAGGEIVHLANSANQQVQCGPFSAKAPVAQYFEERFGAPGAAAQLGDDAEPNFACASRIIRGRVMSLSAS